MLSYDTPVSYDKPASVNTQKPMSSANMSPGLQAMSAQSQGIRPTNGLMHDIPSHHPTGQQHHIWLVTGPAGCGKSTVARYMAKMLNLPYLEGDEFHPKANIEKMSNGIPLTDADRWDWLTLLREESIRQLDAGNNGVVLTCSALKRKYRDVIRVAPYFSPGVHVHFIYLHAPEAVLLQRVQARQGHYMGANMVHSQFEILEPPTPDEIDVMSVDVSRSIDDVNAEVLDRVRTVMKEVEDGSWGR